MNTKEIKINVPEGYEIDKENSTFECIKLKPIKNNPPKTWEEFCKKYPKKVGEAYIAYNSDITVLSFENGCRRPNFDKSILPSKELAEAMLALCQLIQLRDCYNDGWQPDWTSDSAKHVVYSYNSGIVTGKMMNSSHILTFKNSDLCDAFLENFRDLIEIAKPLL